MSSLELVPRVLGQSTFVVVGLKHEVVWVIQILCSPPNVLSNSYVVFQNQCFKMYIGLWLCLFLFVSGWSSVRCIKFHIFYIFSMNCLSICSFNVLDYILSHKYYQVWFLFVGNYMVPLSSPHLCECLLAHFVSVTPVQVIYSWICASSCSSARHLSHFSSCCPHPDCLWALLPLPLLPA